MRLTLPSGLRVGLTVTPGARGAERLADTLALFGTAVTIDHDVETLSLGDFHVLYAVLSKLGVVAEAEVTIDCFNCDAELVIAPCKSLEIGPWLDGEVDAELDVTLPFGQPHALASPVKLGRVRLAHTLTLAPRTVKQARSLFTQNASPDALGVLALGSERDPVKIAEALAHPDALAAIADVWLASHYVPRLHASVICGSCQARNDVDAPYDRELERGPSGEARDVAFPSFKEWNEAVRELAEPLLEEGVLLLTDDGVPATDAGGDVVWGHYEEPVDDPGTPSLPATITLYYRTFALVWKEEGPYDWREEVTETLEHELEHHVGYLRGEDPMAVEEDAALATEATRVVGRRESQRRASSAFGASLLDFLHHTWPLWALLILALVGLYGIQP